MPKTNETDAKIDISNKQYVRAVILDEIDGFKEEGDKIREQIESLKAALSFNESVILYLEDLKERFE